MSIESKFPNIVIPITTSQTLTIVLRLVRQRVSEGHLRIIKAYNEPFLVPFNPPVLVVDDVVMDDLDKIPDEGPWPDFSRCILKMLSIINISLQWKFITAPEVRGNRWMMQHKSRSTMGVPVGCVALM
jgi:hypothetical protein